MKPNSIDTLALIKQTVRQSMRINHQQYENDLASGLLTDLKEKCVAYLGGQIMRDKQNTIVSDLKPEKLLERLPKDEQLYYVIRVGFKYVERHV